MRIVSKFHDYYDAAQAMGQSPTIYQREQKIENVKEWPFPQDWKWNTGYYYGWARNRSTVINKPRIVGFCGKIYPLQILKIPSKDGVGKPLQEVFCYCQEDVDRFIHQNFKKKEQIEAYQNEKGKRWKYRNTDYWNGTKRNDYELFFKMIDEKNNAFENMFLEHKSPIFIAKKTSKKHGCEGEIAWDACLKDVNFARIKDVYTAAQEIEMFLNNLASPEKPIPHVSDEDLAFVKGFDKWSFRKEPSKK